jgi:hypothetical protein
MIAFMLSVIMIGVLILSVIVLSVVAPISLVHFEAMEQHIFM